MNNRRLAIALTALVFTTSAVSALTVINNGPEEITIGIDDGATETVHKVPAGKSTAVTDVCVKGCGVTGPWGYSYMARPADSLVVKDSSLTIEGERVASQHADSCWAVQRWIGLCDK